MLPALGIMIDRWNPTIHGISLVYSSNAAINICMAAPFLLCWHIAKGKEETTECFQVSTYEPCNFIGHCVFMREI